MMRALVSPRWPPGVDVSEPRWPSRARETSMQANRGGLGGSVSAIGPLSRHAAASEPVRSISRVISQRCGWKYACRQDVHRHHLDGLVSHPSPFLPLDDRRLGEPHLPRVSGPGVSKRRLR
jgi:hypothetical protein